jgi:hypothetical protein
LRTLLVAMTLAAMFLGWQVLRVQRQRAAVAAVLGLGGTLHYDYQFDEQVAFVHDAQPSAPRWASDLVGEDYFAKVVAVDLSGADCRDEHLVDLLGLPALRELNLTNTPITDAGVAYLAKMTNLTSLSIADTRVSDEGVVALIRLPRLQRLSLEGSDVTPATIRKLLDARPEWTVLY